MNLLDLTYINRLAPYKVWLEGSDYLVETNHGLLFRIGFMDDQSIWPSGAYQFTINNESNKPSPNDQQLKATVFRIIEAFFAANPDILLYICETGDGRQALRSRLFVHWFRTYAGKDSFVIKTAEVQEDDTRNFAALIVQKSNPRLQEIIAEFDETIDVLTNKPD